MALNNIFHEIVSIIQIIVDFVCSGFILFLAADSHKWTCNAKMCSMIFFHKHCKHTNVSDLLTFRPISEYLHGHTRKTLVVFHFPSLTGFSAYQPSLPLKFVLFFHFPLIPVTQTKPVNRLSKYAEGRQSKRQQIWAGVFFKFFLPQATHGFAAHFCRSHSIPQPTKPPAVQVIKDDNHALSSIILGTLLPPEFKAFPTITTSR